MYRPFLFCLCLAIAVIDSVQKDVKMLTRMFAEIEASILDDILSKQFTINDFKYILANLTIQHKEKQ